MSRTTLPATRYASNAPLPYATALSETAALQYDLSSRLCCSSVRYHSAVRCYSGVRYAAALYCILSSYSCCNSVIHAIALNYLPMCYISCLQEVTEGFHKTVEKVFPGDTEAQARVMTQVQQFRSMQGLRAPRSSAGAEGAGSTCLVDHLWRLYSRAAEIGNSSPFTGACSSQC